MSEKLKALAGLTIFLVVVLVALAIYNNTNGFIQKELYGPEYCFKDTDQSAISIAAQGVEVRYTKTEGNQLCFRTKDSSLIERINQQIENRKLQESLAKIQASDRFWNQTFPILVVTVIIGIIIIALIIVIAGGNRSYY
jgi:hypothetical protein